MDSYSLSSLIHENRPPGGTRRPGNKTPRKVQWVGGEEESPERHTRALDEHGLNLEPLETLQDALERHRTLSPSGSSTPLHEMPPIAFETRAAALMDQKPTREVPGETWIGADETAGLPKMTREEYHEEKAQAAQQRQQQQQRKKRSFWSRLGFKSRSDDGTPPKKSISRYPDTDVEDMAEAPTPTPRFGRGPGILSNLLTLYDSATPGALTPATSSFEDLASAAGRIGHGYGGRLSLKRTMSSMSSLSGTEKSPHSSSRRAGFPFHDPRPPSARNGAGVFGALVASTANLSGPAAPTSSSLAPSVKRPGYHLSRYSLDANVPLAPPATAIEPPSRPVSVHFDTTGHTFRGSESPGTDSPDTPSSTTPPGVESPMLNKSQIRKRWSGALMDLPKRGWSRTPASSTPGTPTTTDFEEWLTDKDEQKPLDADSRRKERKRRRKKVEIYITRHVAQIIQRQEFICKLARAVMMFGGPSHRLQAQIQATARVLDVELSCMYLPDMMLISFDDSTTGTSNIKLIRQGGAFNIAKLQATHKVYWKAIHDDLSVNDASSELDSLMRNPTLYNKWQLIFFGGMCSATICSVSFNGSFIDSVVSFPLGCLLIVIQLFANTHELYSNIFEITVATLFSFIAAALSETKIFCYSAIASSSVVLILPGYIILCGSLELSSHNIVSGAVRVCFSVIYSLFLGFGLAIGSSAFSKISKHPLRNSDDLMCTLSHPAGAPWYQQTPSLWWAFFTVPMYSLWLSLRFYAPWNRKELVLLVAISSIGWTCNHFTGTKFPGQSDISAAVGALAVGFVSNLYARFFRGNAFVIMITGILFQLPSGVANGGLFTFVQKQDSGQSSSDVYLSGFQTALQLVSVAIGLTVGLGVSLVLVFPIQSRRRAAGIFSL
ncbi:hypothetical protein BDY19DRAFT_375413 [Irpex rosettiformis]|uniref:Uncharacterized protein n=1 Tax=Irpex rosettiformis TaxID=378272 RepID=A0ACB8TVF6_9APHY|nr:hypothetical protein BDY19DRAFT_375413 [Irpex rosettiformis]